MPAEPAQRFSTAFYTQSRDVSIANSQANSYCINGEYYYVPHRHEEHFDWIYLADGTLEQIINGRPRTLRAGDLLWIRRGDWHEAAGHGMHFYIICGTDVWLESLMSSLQTMGAYRAFLELDEPPLVQVPPRRRPELAATWERCWAVQHGPLGPAHITRLAMELFVDLFLPLVWNVAQYRVLPHWLRVALNYIHTHVGEPITSVQLADVCCKSPEHVARSFQLHLGTTPSQYINLTRLNYAAHLLSRTDRSILDISMTAGFGSLGHFYRLFKKRFNRSPRAYRLS